jgi:hypothetical protein
LKSRKEYNNISKKVQDRFLTGFLGETDMARLPDETVTRIKREVSLVRLAEARGFELKPHGSHYAIHCPFHADDKTPSLIITPEKNLFHCPACGAKGSPIDWVMKIEGVSMRHALELLVNDLPHLVAPGILPPATFALPCAARLASSASVSTRRPSTAALRTAAL